jgi:hypothetical protein
MILSATILVSSLSFALGTLLPHLTTLIKIVIALAWFIGTMILSTVSLFSLSSNTPPPAWYVNWDPTSAITAAGVRSQYAFPMGSLASGAAQFQHDLLTIENAFPNNVTWFGPHLILAGLSLLLVVWASMTFRRFRNAVRG